MQHRSERVDTLGITRQCHCGPAATIRAQHLPGMECFSRSKRPKARDPMINFPDPFRLSRWKEEHTMFQRSYGSVTTPLTSDRLQTALRARIRLAMCWNTDERGTLSCRWKDSFCAPSATVAVLSTSDGGESQGSMPPPNDMDICGRRTDLGVASL